MGWIGGNKAAQVSVRRTLFVALLVGGLAWPVFAAWPANKQDASWQNHVDGRRPAPELTVEERHLALTQQLYRDPEDFDRYVRLHRMYDEFGNQIFFAVPVAYSAKPLWGAGELDERGFYRLKQDELGLYAGYSRYHPYSDRLRKQGGTPHPLDAYQLPTDPDNDRHPNGVLRWQPMVIDGVEHMVLHNRFNRPVFVDAELLSLMFHLPDLRPVDREMYKEVTRYRTRRQGYFGDRYFPPVTRRDDPLSQGYFWFKRGFSVMRDRFSLLIEEEAGGGNFYAQRKQPYISREHGLIRYGNDRAAFNDPDGKQFYRTELGDDIVLEMTCARPPFSCHGHAVFASDDMGFEFWIPRYGPRNYRHWRMFLETARDLVVNWHIEDARDVRWLWSEEFEQRCRMVANMTEEKQSQIWFPGRTGIDACP